MVRPHFPVVGDLHHDGCSPFDAMRVDLSLQTLDHEGTVLQNMEDGTALSLERALLALSGLKTVEEIGYYHHKIDDIWGRFLKKCDTRGLFDHAEPPLYLHQEIAKRLFDHLWNSKPKRFGEYFLLADVVDAQLDPDVRHSVGTCVGLTSLYSVLGLRAGLNLSLWVGSDHLLSRLRVGQQTIDIDHTDPLGFDCRSGEAFREFPLLTLTANVLNSRGLRSEASGELAAAKADYEKAVSVNPEYANARNNRGNMRFWDEDVEGAMEDYNEAIRLDPRFSEAYCNRGMVKQRLGRYDEARQDYNRALITNPEYGDALKCLLILDELERIHHDTGGVGGELRF